MRVKKTPACLGGGRWMASRRHAGLEAANPAARVTPLSGIIKSNLQHSPVQGLSQRVLQFAKLVYIGCPGVAVGIVRECAARGLCGGEEDVGVGRSAFHCCWVFAAVLIRRPWEMRQVHGSVSSCSGPGRDWSARMHDQDGRTNSGKQDDRHG